MGNYNDIIHLGHHISSKRPQMPISNRAAQFSPFAALTGHDAAVKETARVTDFRCELDDTLKEEIRTRLQIVADKIKEYPVLEITYFRADEHKNGGEYLTISGAVKKIDEYERLVVFCDGQKIPLDEVTDLSGDVFAEMDEEC